MEFAEFNEGQILAEKFLVLGNLGAGGMGTVYKVKQIHLGAEMALKVMHPRNISPKSIQRFRQEARASFSLDHPAIVSVKDFGLMEGDVPYMAMELLAGETLADKLKKAGSISVQEALPIFVQVCRGLGYAHQNGVVHRDIKPSNIMIIEKEGSKFPIVKVLDFGIAKFLLDEDDQDIQTLTRTGELLGTPLYISPEQCSGQKIDARADIYSLGCVFFEVLTGAPPFVGDSTLATLMKHESEKAPSLTSASLGKKFPPALEKLIAHMLEKNRNNRVSDMNEIASQLESPALFNEAEQSRTEAKSKTKTASKLSPAAAYAIGAVGMGAVAAMCLFAGAPKPAPRIPDRSTEAAPHALPAVEQNLTTSKSNAAHSGDAHSGDANPSDANSSKAESENDDTDTVIRLPPEEEHNWLMHKFDTDRGNHLVLNGHTLGYKSLAMIAHQPGYTGVTFEDCEFDEGADLSQLAGSKMIEIKLSHTAVTAKGIEGLTECSTLTSLLLSNAINDKQSLQAIGKLKQLQALDLTNSKVTDDDIKNLLKLPKLQLLSLNECYLLTDNALRYIGDSGILFLHLRHSKITDVGLSYLAKNPNLSQLDLTGTNVSFAGVNQLCSDTKSKTLHDIDVYKCPKITPSVLLRLQAAHSKTTFEAKNVERVVTD